MNDLKKEFVPYKESLELKKLGFDEPCFGYYTMHDSYLFQNKVKSVPAGFILAPLYRQVFKWFIEKYQMMHIISCYDFQAEICFLDERVDKGKPGLDYIHHEHIEDENGDSKKFNSYEEAELECLKKLIEICKNE